MNAFSDTRLAGRTALVTGAAGGLGRPFAEGLAAAGAGVIALDRPERAAQLDELVGELRERGTPAWSAPVDLSRTDALADAVDRLRDTAGPLSILVNNAGVASLERFNQVDLSSWRSTMTVNVEAPFVLTRRVAEHMIRDGIRGRIVNITSKNAHVAEIGLLAYNTSKGALQMMTQSFALELAPFGITVNALAPGMVDTGISDSFDWDEEGFAAYYRGHIPLEHRYGAPEELLGALLLLASDAGSYLTGHALVVDGGVLAQQVAREHVLPPYRSTLSAVAEGRPDESSP